MHRDGKTIRIDKLKRHLRVVRDFSEVPKPRVVLAGRWLSHAGFEIGGKVEVTVRRHRVVIRPACLTKE